jgi:hypothetical protein
MTKPRNPIAGKTIEWTFTDGPMAEKSFEHAFGADGSVSFKLIGGEDRGKATRIERCFIEPVGKDVYAVSYTSESGYTLTVVLDYRTYDLVAFASNDKGVSVSHGNFEEASSEAHEPSKKAASGRPTKKSQAASAPAAARR